MFMTGSMSAADSFRWSPLAELQEAALGSGTTRPWSTRSHAEMRETSPLTIIAYRGCRHTDPTDSSNVTPAQHQMRALGLKLPRPPQSGQPLRPRMKGRRVRAAIFSRASGAQTASGMFLPGAFQLRRERSSPVGMKPCWLVQVPAVSNRPAQEALAAQAVGTNSYGVAGSAWLHTFSRRTKGSGRNFSRWMSPVGVRRLSWRSPGWCPGLVG